MDATDHSGNTALHILCGDKANAESARECIAMLVCQIITIQNKYLHLIQYVYRSTVEQD